jgi:hypothetical protein
VTILHGLDRADPPAAAKAKAMLAEIGRGNWWNVCIGGPAATHRWTPQDVQAYERAGIGRFLLC